MPNIIRLKSDVAKSVAWCLTCQKMKDAPKAPPMLFDIMKIFLQIEDQFDSSYILQLNAEGDEIPGMADDKTEKINAVVTALKIMGGIADSQAILKNAVMVELKCGETTARNAISQALDLRKIIIKQGKGKAYSYVLPEDPF